MPFSIAFILAFTIVYILIHWNDVSKDRKLSMLDKLWKIASIMFCICIAITIIIITCGTTVSGTPTAYQGVAMFGGLLEICISAVYMAIYIFIVIPIHLIRKFTISEK